MPVLASLWLNTSGMTAFGCQEKRVIHGLSLGGQVMDTSACSPLGRPGDVTALWEVSSSSLHLNTGQFVAALQVLAWAGQRCEDRLCGWEGLLVWKAANSYTVHWQLSVFSCACCWKTTWTKQMYKCHLIMVKWCFCSSLAWYSLLQTSSSEGSPQAAPCTVGSWQTSVSPKYPCLIIHTAQAVHNSDSFFHQSSHFFTFLPLDLDAGCNFLC